ncbi:SixA phosphatase family protein [Yoonia sp. 208BN28-4]|uniref:SixA phosphatase family protein n=1 Tax=Yoonia sp. 208BN28-4 TaxID=3126505 RepID=UPI0030B06966
MTTNRRLILIRHAKSGWDDAFADDHERKLTTRGHTAARAIGEWLSKQAYSPDLILSSDATRTAQTSHDLIEGLGAAPELILVPALYHPSPDTICEVAQKHDAPTIAIVSHNPGTAMCAAGLIKQRPAHHRFSDYPTCATTVIDFPAADFAKRGKGTCIDFIVPRDLTD